MVNKKMGKLVLNPEAMMTQEIRSNIRCWNFPNSPLCLMKSSNLDMSEFSNLFPSPQRQNYLADLGRSAPANLVDQNTKGFPQNFELVTKNNYNISWNSMFFHYNSDTVTFRPSVRINSTVLVLDMMQWSRKEINVLILG